MNGLRFSTLLAIGLAWTMAVGPQSTVGAQPASVATPPTSSAADVALQPDGSLRGVVVDVQGVPAATTTVLFRQSDREVARALTDGTGCYSVRGLREGVYQVTIDRYARLLRVWTPQTAPPGARPFALIVVGEDTIRGQQPLSFPSMSLRHAATLTGIAAGAIAAPVIYHNTLQQNRVPTSP